MLNVRKEAFTKVDFELFFKLLPMCFFRHDHKANPNWKQQTVEVSYRKRVITVIGSDSWWIQFPTLLEFTCNWQGQKAVRHMSFETCFVQSTTQLSFN